MTIDLRRGMAAKDSSWYSQLERSYSQPRGEITSWPSGKYNTIYIDPPWPFEDRISSHIRGAANYYPCLSVKQIEDLDVSNLAADNCLLWMWIPKLFRRWGEEVIESWGFVPKTEWVWVKTTLDGTKIRAGMGRYNRMAHEYLMLGTKGTARPLNGEREVSVICAPRSEHSRKPDAFYELIERNSQEPRIELFARSRRQGWGAWGNEVHIEDEQTPLRVQALSSPLLSEQEPISQLDKLRAKLRGAARTVTSIQKKTETGTVSLWETENE